MKKPQQPNSAIQSQSNSLKRPEATATVAEVVACTSNSVATPVTNNHNSNVSKRHSVSSNTNSLANVNTEHRHHSNHHSATTGVPSLTNSELYLNQHPSVERIESKDLILNLNVNTINSNAKNNYKNADYQSSNMVTDESDYERTVTQQRRASVESQPLSNKDHKANSNRENENSRRSSRTPTSMSSSLSRSSSNSTLRDDDEDVGKDEEAIINDIQDSSGSPQNEPSPPPPILPPPVTLRLNPANGIRNPNQIQRY